MDQAAAAMTRRGIVLFALMSVIWGIPYLFIRVAVDEISPATLVLARTGIATLILLPVALARTDLRSVLAHWRWVAAFAIIEIAIPWVLLGSAEQQISSSLAGLLVAGVPLVGVAIALTTGGADRVSGRGLVGLLIGLAGVVAIVGGDFEASNATALIQVGIVVVCYAIGPAILSRRLNGVPSLGVMAVSLAACAVVYVPIVAADPPATMPGGDVIASLLVLGTLCTAAAFILFAALIAEVGPIRATVITYVNPAVAAVLGVVVLNETFTVAMAVGFALVILGSTLGTRRSSIAAGSEAPEATLAGP